MVEGSPWPRSGEQMRRPRHESTSAIQLGMGITSVIGVTNHVREGSIATDLLVSIPDMGNADYTGGQAYVKTAPG
jgi:hypothetical protein